MKWGRHSGPRGYHHGNLKEALVRAALDLIAEKGPAGFTFADAARWAGVSPAAPYRHFRDRDELLTDVARRGFEQFSAALAPAWDEGKPDLFSAFDRLGKAYLSFRQARAGLLLGDVRGRRAARCRSAIARGERARLRGAARGGRKAGGADAGEGPSAGADGGAARLELTHGIASLFSRGDAARRALPMPPEELLEAAILIYLRGLGLPDGAATARG